MNHVRWLIRRDMAEVVAIEAESFVVPWTELLARLEHTVGQVLKNAGVLS